ncbi:MAG: hypothetical protein EBS05_19580 [Proteobacteria bacterium]|nr:hypothetical protein [Pseudomonadota bacterium]
MNLWFNWLGRWMLIFFSLVVISRTSMAADADRTPTIIIDETGWGQTRIVDMEKVLQSAAQVFWEQCPNTRLDPIWVHHRKDHPQADWKRDRQGRIVVGLASGERLWAQMAFQFAHEFAHVLAAQSNDPNQHWHNDKHANMWLEESLCETASLFALRRMGERWQTAPPYAKWKSYAASLANYAQQRLADPKRQLPPGTTFAEWFAQQQPGLRKHPTQRELNCVIATQLLPLFEAEPEHWESLTCLNLGPHDEDKSLAQHLAEWTAACPAKHRPFIAKLGAVFTPPR